jgi:hypothetical protein
MLALSIKMLTWRHRPVVRTQVQLTPEQAELLRRISAERGVSMAALLREAIEAWGSSTGALSDGEKRRRATAAIGVLSGGPDDLAARHDDYFVESILQ